MMTAVRAWRVETKFEKFKIPIFQSHWPSSCFDPMMGFYELLFVQSQPLPQTTWASFSKFSFVTSAPDSMTRKLGCYCI